MNAMDQDSHNTCATLDFIYHFFNKFVVDPELFLIKFQLISTSMFFSIQETPTLKNTVGKENMKNTPGVGVNIRSFLCCTIGQGR